MGEFLDMNRKRAAELVAADVSTGGDERNGPDSGIGRLSPGRRSGRSNVAVGITGDNGRLADLEQIGAVDSESTEPRRPRRFWRGSGWKFQQRKNRSKTGQLA